MTKKLKLWWDTMWVKGESHFERLKTKGRTKSEYTKRDKTRNYVDWWRITILCKSHFKYSGIKEQKRWDRMGPGETKWEQKGQEKTRRGIYVAWQWQTHYTCFALTFWNRKRDGKEWDEMRRQWDIKSPDTEDPLYANLTWSILQEEERK